MVVTSVHTEKVQVLVAQSCGLFCNTVACKAPLSLEFFRQEYWSRLPFPLSGGSSKGTKKESGERENTKGSGFCFQESCHI